MCYNHLVDEVQLLASLYPEHRDAIMKAPRWMRGDTGPSRNGRGELVPGHQMTFLEWKAPSIGPGKDDILVPDHVAVPRGDGSFDIYIIALLTDAQNLGIGAVRRARLRGVPIGEW